MVMDFMLRQDAARFMMGKYLIDKQIPYHRRPRRHLGMTVAGITNSQSANQNRKDAISRVSAVQGSAKGPS